MSLTKIIDIQVKYKRTIIFASLIGQAQDLPPTKFTYMEHIRYSAAACQTDQPNPTDRREMRRNTDRILSMIDSAVAGHAPFLPVRLVVFPEFAHAAPIFETCRKRKTIG